MVLKAKQLRAIKSTADLKHDPKNARSHGDRNLGMIADSLREVGAARSIVISEDGTVLAGNGVLAASAKAGISKVRVIESDGDEIIAVRRAGLTKKQKTRLALADNRVAESSEWNPQVLAELLSNGEQFRVMMARTMLEGGAQIVMDEFTSVVDRQVAQIGAHAAQKHIRKATDRRFVAASCHYDIVDWLQPDWIFEPATMTFTRRSLQGRPSIEVEISRVGYEAWGVFTPRQRPVGEPSWMT